MYIQDEDVFCGAVQRKSNSCSRGVVIVKAVNVNEL